MVLLRMLLPGRIISFRCWGCWTEGRAGAARGDESSTTDAS